jgi:transcriptional regulator GlxA family with amidase domain
VGLPPKRFSRLVRFHRAFPLVAGSALALAEIALQCGYADQSHFTNDFRELAGLSPARMRAMGPRRVDDLRFVFQ